MATKKLAPVHPGEILREEFMTPLGLARIVWDGTWGYRPGASTRSCTASAVSRRIRHCD